MNKIIIVGSGPMAEAYTKVLCKLNAEFIVVGRSNESANIFYKNTGIMPVIGGIEKFVSKNKIVGYFGIIATGTESLISSLKILISAGIDKILLEKPGAISIDELCQNFELLKPHAKNIFIAYNRRYFSSVLNVLELVKNDGGLKSMHFEFTEWANKISPLIKAPKVKENWFFANSTHVIDLAFFIGGKPQIWSTFSKEGSLEWHKKSLFVGSGITENGVLFSYCSNWESPGRWGIELMTKNHRFYLKPLEEIKIQKLNSIEIEDYKFDNRYDIEFKPGLYWELKTFLNNQKDMLDLENHFFLTNEVYSKILNGNK